MTQPLHYTLFVTGPAYGTQQARSAYQFANALLTQQHRIDAIFFYQAGVDNANQLSAPASDEFDLVRAWESLAKKHDIALHVCVAAALRRGIVDEANAPAASKIANLSPAFTLSGLGALAQATLTSDRVIQF